MTSRLLGRLNDQAFATLSAVRYGPVRRIGFLVMPPTSCVGGSSPAAARLIGAACGRPARKNQGRAHRYDAKAIKCEGLADPAQQSYQCVIEIVISSSFNEARRAHPKTLQPVLQMTSRHSVDSCKQ
jgi:hypothetical protein